MKTQIGPRALEHLIALNRTVSEAALPAATQELVRIRSSQINGCSGCLDIHSKDAVAAGGSAVRLAVVAAWRDTVVFTDAERAALELTELGTRLADGGGVPDDAWAAAAKHYDDEQLLALVALIGVINAFSRMNVMTRQVGGSYVAGQYA